MPTPSIHVAVPVLLISLIVFALAQALSRQSAFYRRIIDKEIAAPRFHAVDGLRGYLALGVVFHHIALSYLWYHSGIWGGGIVSNLGVFLGDGSVSFFFMITAFLFWNRAMDEEGRLDAYKFYVSRLRRLVPMYLAAAGLLAITALAITGFHLTISPSELMQEIFAWLLFTIPGTPTINQFKDTVYINTVFWSLVLEWRFYVVLPFIAVFAPPRYRWYAVAFAALCTWFFSKSHFEWYFLAGCVTAMLTRLPAVRAAATGRIASLVAIACVAVTTTYAPMGYSLTAAAPLLIPFIIFASGNSMFGLLTCRAARLLGLLSYSVYLLHNWVLFVASKTLDRYASISHLSEIWYWVFGAGVAIATVMLASVTYRFIESPFMRSSAGARTFSFLMRPRWIRWAGLCGRASDVKRATTAKLDPHEPRQSVVDQFRAEIVRSDHQNSTSGLNPLKTVSSRN